MQGGPTGKEAKASRDTVGSVGSDSFEIAHTGGRRGNDTAESRSEIRQICSQTEGVAFSLQGRGCPRGTLSRRE